VTVSRDTELGVMLATCDQCGETVPLDDRTELVARGWRLCASQTHHFKSDYGVGYTETYARDLCATCASDEPAPRPRYGSGRRAMARVTDDPCDDWPRALVWRALGLRETCGHPLDSDPVHCGACERGQPIGDSRAWWQR
jgi:hypothetical protein